MAGINLSSLILYDNWPGFPTIVDSRPSGGWDNTTDNFTTTSATDREHLRYPIGTKIAAYTDNSWCPGWFTMMYLMYHSPESKAIEGCISADFSDGNFWCTKADGSTAEVYATIAETSTVPYYVVSNCVTKSYGEVSTITSLAVPCCSLNSDGTGAYVAGYGDTLAWFWVGGVCPAKEVTIMDNASAGIASTCQGLGVCVTGNFPTYATGTFFMEHSAAISTNMITCDITSVGDVTDLFNSGTPQPLGRICMTAI